MAVSYVFCYRTPEGKEIINKWWSTKRDNLANYGWLCCINWNKRKRPREQGLLARNKRFNQSSRSNNSSTTNCNGKADLVGLELVNIQDTPSTANKDF